MKSESDSTVLKLLHEMATSKSPEYAKQAQKVLEDVSSFDIKFIEQLVDAYLNDPYLTKS
jgi:hypothetical protein